MGDTWLGNSTWGMIKLLYLLSEVKSLLYIIHHYRRKIGEEEQRVGEKNLNDVLQLVI